VAKRKHKGLRQRNSATGSIADFQNNTRDGGHMDAIDRGLAISLVLLVMYIALEIYVHNRRVDD
jgi:hypothetical protein